VTMLWLWEWSLRIGEGRIACDPSCSCGGAVSLCEFGIRRTLLSIALCFQGPRLDSSFLILIGD
jgi:hypothetical protein